MIVGVGIDVADVDRFAAALDRTPRMKDRLFTADEVIRPDGRPLTVASLAARFAAKEAVAKVLGAPAGLKWHDCEVLSDDTGRPLLRMRRTVQAAADQRGIRCWHISLSHDGGMATALVIAEGP